MAKTLTYPALTAPAVGDAFQIVDISDTTDDVTGSTKYITYDTLLGPLGWKPIDQGLLAYNYDPVGVNVNQSTPTGGTLYNMAIEVPVCSVTGVVVYIGSAGGTVTHSTYALYNAAGTTRLAVTADNNTAHQATGVVQTNFTSGPIAITTAGIYYVSFVYTATTVPSLGRLGASSGVNAGTTSTNYRFSTGATGLTATPTTRSTMTAGTASYWVGLI